MATSMNDDQVPFLTSSSQPMDMMEGDLTSSTNRTNQNELSTLDEPVLETIKRLSFPRQKRKVIVFLF